MSRAKWLGIVVAMTAWGCEAGPEPEAEPIEPLPPLEVMGPAEEIARLRARVSELERQLEGCPAPSSTETAAVPEGVDVPEAPVERAEATGAASSKRPVRRDPSLLDSVLPRRRGDDTIELPNPARLLLGDE